MKGLIPQVKLFFKQNGSTILSCAAAAGVVATAIAAAKATPKAMQILEYEEEQKGEQLTNFEKFKIAAPAYIPAALIGAGTVSCIFGAHVLNKRQQAALLSLYSLVNSSYKEYQNKTKELYGANGDRRIKQAIANDRYFCEFPIAKDDGKQIFLDYYSLQFFQSTPEKVKEAEKTMNELISTRGYALVGEYYELLGLKSIYEDYESGWSNIMMDNYGCGPFELEFDSVTTENGDEFQIITMAYEPMPTCYM